MQNIFFFSWKVICLRIFVNLIVLGLLTFSAVAVIFVVRDSKDKHTSWWRRNSITLVLSTISFFFPMFFEALGLLEYYHPRQQLRIQLARIMVLNLLNLFSLIFALFDKIGWIQEQSNQLKIILDTTSPMMVTTETITTDSYSTTTLAAMIVTTILPLLAKSSSIPLTTTTYQTTVTPSSYINTLPTSTGHPFTTVSDLYATKAMNFTDMNDFITQLTTFTTTTTPGPETTLPIDYPKELEHYYFEDDSRRKRRQVNSETVTTVPTIGIGTTPTGDKTSSPMYLDDFNSTDLDFGNLNFTDVVTTIWNDLNSSTDNTTEWDVGNLTDFVTERLDQLLTTTLESNYDEEYDDEEVIDEEEASLDDEDYYKSAGEGFPSLSTTTEVSTTFDYSELTTLYSLMDLLPTTAVSSTTYKPNKTYEEADKEVRQLCWETMFGQELVKLTVMDLIITIASTMLLDFFRALFVRYLNGCWCWDLEKKYPQYGDFKIAENILHLVNNQGMVWMGMFFSPGLAIINLVKLFILMYLRSWTVLTCNVPHEVVFKASSSNNFYLTLLLTMLFLCVLPVSYAMVLLTPSWHCGPFSGYDKIYYLFTNYTMNNSSEFVQYALHYIASPAAVIPLLVLMILIIYYLISLTGSLREANHDLRIQLRKERTEERKKMWKLAEEQTKDPNQGPNVLTSRWKKVLEGAQSPNPDNPVGGGGDKAEARKQLLARIMKKALRKESATSDEDSLGTNAGDDATDTEMNESLPHDHHPPPKSATKPKTKVKNPFAQIIALAKEKEKEKEKALTDLETKENHENTRKETEGCSKHEDDEQIVAERRRTGFKRQENISAINEKDTDVKTKVETVNEKSKKPQAVKSPQPKKASKNKTSSTAPPTAVTPEPPLVFKFDESLTTNEPEKVKSGKNKKGKRGNRCSPHHEVSDDESVGGNRQPMELTKGNGSPHYVAPKKIIRPVESSDEKAPDYDEVVVKPKVDPVENDKDLKQEKNVKRKSYSEIVKGEAIVLDEKEAAATDVKQESKPVPTPQPKEPEPKVPETKKKTEVTVTKPVTTETPSTSTTTPSKGATKKEPTVKGRKKFNNFLNLVKEAVQIKRQEQESQSKEPPKPESEPSKSSKPEKKIEKQKDSLEKPDDKSKNTFPRHGSKKSAKRQDSVASIWSDNIPVITISKTESDECILDDQGPVKKKQLKSKGGIDEPKKKDEKRK